MEELKNFLTATLRSWGADVVMNKLIPALVILAVGLVAIRLITKLTRKALERSKLEQAAYSLIQSAVRIVLWILLLLSVASSLSIDVTGIVALASVLSLAVSLAVQNLLADVIGGFTLLYTKPFHSGDFVEIAGQGGVVREIGLSYTRLTTGDNKLISIPNSAVVSAQIVNYSATGTRRVDITVQAAYDTPVESVLEALREAAMVDTALVEKAPFAAVKEYGQSGIVYVLQVWSSAEDYWTTLFEVNKNIKTVLDAKGITMPYPHLNVHLDR